MTRGRKQGNPWASFSPPPLTSTPLLADRRAAAAGSCPQIWQTPGMNKIDEFCLGQICITGWKPIFWWVNRLRAVLACAESTCTFLSAKPSCALTIHLMSRDFSVRDYSLFMIWLSQWYMSFLSVPWLSILSATCLFCQCLDCPWIDCPFLNCPWLAWPCLTMPDCLCFASTYLDCLCLAGPFLDCLWLACKCLA